MSDAGVPLGANEKGNIALKLPLPLGCLIGTWGDDTRVHDSYLTQFPGYYTLGDGGYLDEDGYVFIMGLTDDVINIAGHRLSTGEMEEVVVAHEMVAECAVIGVQNDLKGQLPMALVLLKAGASIDETQLSKEIVTMLRKTIRPIAVLKSAHIVAHLPKTRSGNIIRHIANGETFVVPATIDDPASLDEIKKLVTNIDQH